MKNHIYLESEERQEYIDDINIIFDLYLERIKPTFAEPEKEADEYMKIKMREQMYSINAQFDPEECLQEIWNDGCKKFEFLSLMQYRTLGMWISCMCQLWEQQLFTNILHEARMESVKYDDEEIKQGFLFTSDILMAHNINYKNICNGKIEELRLLVNTLKHSIGKSEEKLRIIRPDYFINNGRDILKFTHSTLLENTLYVTDKDFEDYKNALVAFWIEFPEHAYSDENFLKIIDE